MTSTNAEASPLILDGRKMANEYTHCLRNKVAKLKEETGKSPRLDVCLVGDDAASQIYVSKKQQKAQELGIESQVHHFASDVNFQELLDAVKRLNDDEQVTGILLQLPLPEGFDPDPLLLQINPLKDVDGLHPFNLGMLMAGSPHLVPCTPFGIMRLLRYYEIALKGRNVVVLGRSRLVGKPIAQLLQNESATVSVLHSRTPATQVQDFLARADIVVAAIGQPSFVQGSSLKRGAVLIDVGINRLESGKLVGDFDYETCAQVASAITPVPGGVGPLTVAHLFLNTIKAFELQCFGSSSIEL